MRTISYELELQADRVLTVKLPDDISPGKHKIALIVEENLDVSAVQNTEGSNSKDGRFQKLLNQTSGLWLLGDGLAYQMNLRREWGGR